MSSKGSETARTKTAGLTLIGTQLGELGSKAITAPMDADLQAKAVRRMVGQTPADTDRRLKELVERSNVGLKNDHSKHIRTKAISTSRQAMDELTMSFRLAFSPTPKDLADMFFSGMIARGLAYRNDGPKLADAKMMSYSRMFQKYPPDAVNAACGKLRRDGWLPSSDTLEAEIRDALEWRGDVLRALLDGEILTPEQIQERRERVLGFKVIEIYDSLPVWDRGTETCADRRERGLTDLTAAVNAFKAEASDDHYFKEVIRRAEEWLEGPFLPYPYREKTEAEREQERADFEANKAEKVQALLDDDKT